LRRLLAIILLAGLSFAGGCDAKSDSTATGAPKRVLPPPPKSK
jgi:hypothetical protein